MKKQPTKVTGRNTAAARKWGKKVMDHGFCIVPSLLFKAQGRLGLNPTQLAVLLQLCEHWWEPDNKPHPGKRRLAERLGIGPRQIQRYIASLEQAGLVKRIERRSGSGAKQTNTYDLSGLVERLKKLEPEFRRAEDTAKAARRAVTQRGHRLRGQQ